MTTESSAPEAERRDEQEIRAIFAEGRRNRERWQRDWQGIREQFPKHWIAIYDGGKTVVAHEHAQAHYDHISELEGLNRSAVFRWPPPRKPSTRQAPSVFRRRAE